MHVIHGNLSDVIAHRWMCNVTSFNSGILHPDFMRYMSTLYEFMDLLMHVFACVCASARKSLGKSCQTLWNWMHALRLELRWHCKHTRMSCTWTYDPVTMHGSLKPAWDSVSWIVYVWTNFNGWKPYALGTVVCRHVQECSTPRCRSRWQWSLSAHGWEAWHHTHWTKSMTRGPN